MDGENLISTDNDELHILYITIIIIVALIFVWIIVMIFIPDEPFDILTEMTNISNHLAPISDIKVNL